MKARSFARSGELCPAHFYCSSLRSSGHVGPLCRHCNRMLADLRAVSASGLGGVAAYAYEQARRITEGETVAAAMPSDSLLTALAGGMLLMGVTGAHVGPVPACLLCDDSGKVVNEFGSSKDCPLCADPARNCEACMASKCTRCQHDRCPCCIDCCDHPDCIEWTDTGDPESDPIGKKTHECDFPRCSSHQGAA